MQIVGEFEASPWQFGCAPFGAQLILSKRISAPPILSLPPARSRDLDAEAVMGIPRTPDEVGDEAQSLQSAAPALSGEALDEHIEVLAEALTLPKQIGLGAPSTPPVESAPTTPVDVPATSSASGYGDAAMLNVAPCGYVGPRCLCISQWIWPFSPILAVLGVAGMPHPTSSCLITT